jgi:putative salt-induced outer membrane protein
MEARMRLCVAAVAGLIAGERALAQAAPTPPQTPPEPDAAAPAEPDAWSGKIGFGYAAISGNAKSSSAAADVLVKHDRAPWHHEGSGAGYRAVSTDQVNDITATTGERYGLGYKLKYDFAEFDYVFGSLGYERDLFSGYRRQFSEVAGYGRRIFDTERQVWNFEIGAGAKQSELSDGNSQDEILASLGTDYTFKFSSTGAFTQRVGAEFGEENTYLESVTAVSATVIGPVGLNVSYTVKYNTEVPPGAQGTDSFTAVTLQYAF